MFMKMLKKALLLAALAGSLGFTTSAQDFDPAQMRQRMMERVREQLEITNDDEWKIVSERAEKVMTARRDAGGFGGGGMMFGRGGGPGGGRRGEGGGDR